MRAEGRKRLLPSKKGKGVVQEKGPFIGNRKKKEGVRIEGFSLSGLRNGIPRKGEGCRFFCLARPHRLRKKRGKARFSEGKKKKSRCFIHLGRTTERKVEGESQAGMHERKEGLEKAFVRGSKDWRESE